jgi:hypothetical protein
MSQTEYDVAISDFLRSKGVTRCPTACVAPTHGSTAETDRAALRDHENALQAARLQKRSALRRPVTSPGTIMAAPPPQAQLLPQAIE